MIHYRHYAPKGDNNLKDQIIQINKEGFWKKDLAGDVITVDDSILCKSIKESLANYDSTFIYASDGADKWIMLKKTISDGGEAPFTDGYLGDISEIQDYLKETSFDCFINYKNNRETVFSNIRSNFKDPNYQNIDVEMFAQILNAILLGDENSPIIIIVDAKEIPNYISLIYSFLPIQVASKLSFTTGYDKSERFHFSYTDKSDNRFESDIRMVFLEPENKNVAYIFNSFRVFDIPNHKTNYSEKLCALSAALSNMKYSNNIKLSLGCAAQRSFDQENKLDEGLLNVEISQHLFVQTKSLEDARALIQAVSNRYDAAIPREYKASAYDAIRRLLQNCTETDFNLISPIIKGNRDNPNDVEELYFTYLMKNCMEEPNEKTSLSNWISNDPSRIGILVKTISNRRIVLDFLCGYYFSAPQNAPTPSYKETFLELKKYFDQNWNSADNIFVTLSQNPNNSSVEIISAILLCASKKDEKVRSQGKEKYTNQFIKDLVENRFAKNQSIEKILFLIRVHNYTRNLDEVSFFGDNIYDTSFGYEWITELISGLTIEERISLLPTSQGVDRFSGNEEHAETLDEFEFAKKKIIESLNDINQVKKELVMFDSKSTEVFKRYFNSLSEEEQSDEINDWLNQLEEEKDKAKSIKNHRILFLQACCKHFNTNREAVFDPKHSAGDLAKQAQAVTNVFTEHYHDVAKPVKKKFTGVIFSMLGVGLLSAVLLILPSIVQCMMLNQIDLFTIIERVVLVAMPWLCIIPFLAMAINIGTYLLMEKAQKRHSLRSANYMSLICVILPEVVFVLSYVAFYYISLRLF